MAAKKAGIDIKQNYVTVTLCLVYVQPPPSAVNVTLAAFSAECRRLLHGVSAGRSAANPTAAVDRWDRRVLDCSTDPASHTVRAA